jgi:hypothetical protein
MGYQCDNTTLLDAGFPLRGTMEKCDLLLIQMSEVDKFAMRIYLSVLKETRNTVVRRGLHTLGDAK